MLAGASKRRSRSRADSESKAGSRGVDDFRSFAGIDHAPEDQRRLLVLVANPWQTRRSAFAPAHRVTRPRACSGRYTNRALAALARCGYGNRYAGDFPHDSPIEERSKTDDTGCCNRRQPDSSSMRMLGLKSQREVLRSHSEISDSLLLGDGVTLLICPMSQRCGAYLKRVRHLPARISVTGVNSQTTT